MEAWGFLYRTHVIWIKTTKDGSRPKMGMGHWVRGQHELLLIGRRGRFPTPADDAQPRSTFESPATRHSEKPEHAYEIIEKAFPHIEKRLELFARKPRPGWTAWGREAPKPNDDPPPPAPKPTPTPEPAPKPTAPRTTPPPKRKATERPKTPATKRQTSAPKSATAAASKTTPKPKRTSASRTRRTTPKKTPTK